MPTVLSRFDSDKALCIGIVGGMSPESTVTYYQHIVRRHQIEFGDHSYPRIVIASVSFQQYVDWQHKGDWDRITAELRKEFQAVAAAGADFAVLATNTMHKVLPLIALLFTPRRPGRCQRIRRPERFHRLLFVPPRRDY